MRNRTIARELAIKALYQVDLCSDYIISDMDTFCKENTEKPEIYSFAMSLISGCRSHIKEIDEKISSVTEHWELRRMAIMGTPTCTYTRTIQTVPWHRKQLSTKPFGLAFQPFLSRITTRLMASWQPG